MTQKIYEEEYLQKCLRDYLNDDFVVEQSLCLFSYLIKNGIAKNFTKQIRNTAQHLIDVDWIGSDGKIRIGLEEARRESELAQDEVDRENKN